MALLPTRICGTPSRTLRICFATGAALLSFATQSASAQTPAGGRSEVFAGSEFENYLRYLQTEGKSPSSAWSIRGFSPAELDALAPSDNQHPWAGRYAFGKNPRPGLTWDYIRPTVAFTINSAYPFGENDGPVWAGKGLTTSFQTGLAARWGIFSAAFVPVMFRAENQSFPLMVNNQPGRLRFADGQYALSIDRPQSFGTLPYARMDLGQSTIRVDAGTLAAGISTATQWWGPTSQYPFLLGSNAGGFPHFFVGTAKPANIGIGKVHGRLVYGRLGQSPYSAVTGEEYFEDFDRPGRLRFMAGLAGVLQVRGIRGLEFGGARFFHSANRKDGITASDLRLPFQGLLKEGITPDSDSLLFGGDRGTNQNQLASIFFRWAPPATGAEFYAEYGREDHSSDVRDFLLQPDHSSATSIGFRKSWLKGATMNAVRAELFTFEAPSSGRTRGEGLIYTHAPLRQGHTFRGQMLGANVGPGSGSAQMLAVERFSPRGRMKGFVSRVTQREFSPLEAAEGTRGSPRRAVDLQSSIGAELLRFFGPFDVTMKAVLTSNLNRYFLSDRANGSLSLMIRQDF